MDFPSACSTAHRTLQGKPCSRDKNAVEAEMSRRRRAQGDGFRYGSI
ncbi:hypothetical protein HMPREF3150_00646 [Pseudomonas aeruginosa]|nr:hypothetical protein HMPREF3150_00646 [Pseudomonas aeruginosa]